MRFRLPRLKLSRRALYFFVVLLIFGGISSLFWRAWYIIQPDYHWTQAQAAIAARDGGRAKVELHSLLRKIPGHADGHLAMSQVILAEARAAKKPATYADVPAAMKELESAASLRSGDVRLQKQVLSLHLEAKRMKEASEVAARIVSRDSSDPDVLYALTWSAVERYREASAEVARISDSPRAAYRSMALQVQFETTLGNEERVQQLLVKSLRQAESTPAGELLAMSNREFEALLKLLRWAVDSSADQAMAEARAQQALATLLRLADSTSESAERASRLASAAEAASQTLMRLRARYPVALASKQNPAATEAERAGAENRDSSVLGRPDSSTNDRARRRSVPFVLQSVFALVAIEEDETIENPADKETPSQDTAVETSERAEPALPSTNKEPDTVDPLAAQAEKLRQAAIAAGSPDPLTRHQSALAAFAQGDDRRGIEILKQGIAMSDKLPANRRRELLDLHLLLAQRLIDLNRIAEADENIRALLSDKDGRGWGEWLLGAAGTKQGRFETALEHFRQARRLVGNGLIVRWGLVNAQLGAGQWKEAIEELAGIEPLFAKFNDQQRRPFEQQWFGAPQLAHRALLAHLGLNDWAAVDRDRRSLTGTPMEVPAIAAIGSALIKAGKPAEAAALVGEVRQRLPRHVELAGMEADALVRSGHADDADRIVVEFAAAAPDDLPSQLLLVRWRLAQSKAKEAVAKIEKLEPRYAAGSREHREIAVLKAWCLLQAGDLDAARNATTALKDDAELAPVLAVMTAAIEARDQNWQGAEKALATLRPDDPRNASVELWQGELATAQGKFDAASDALAASLEVTALRDRAASLLIHSLLALVQTQSPAAAQAKVEALLKSHPRDKTLLDAKEIFAALARADAAYRENRIADCLAALDVADKKLPQSLSFAPLAMARACLKGNLADRALVEADRALKRDPSNVAALVITAQSRLLAKRYAEAIEFASAALTRQPDALSALLVEADALRAQQKHAEAAKQLESFIERYPKAGPAYAALAAMYAADGHHDAAAKVCGWARQRNIHEPALAAAEVRSLCALKRMSEAELAAVNAAGTKPEVATCVNLAGAFVAGGAVDTARVWYDKAIGSATDEQKPVIELYLGNLELIDGLARKDKQRLAAARDHFASVLKVQPMHEFAGNNLAWLLATEFEQPAEAVRVAEQVRNGRPVVKLPTAFVDTLIVAYRKANRLDDALRVAEGAVVARPNDPLTHLQAGRLLAANGKALAARRALEMAIKLGLPAAEAQDAERELAALNAPIAVPAKN
jgi:tetratricopeptide (TPR) repeat protein